MKGVDVKIDVAFGTVKLGDGGTLVFALIASTVL